MYPGGNNMPYQPNMMGQPMGLNVPPTQGMMPRNMVVPPAYPPNMPYHPASIPPQSSGYGVAPQTYNPVPYTPTSVFGNASGGQQYADPNSGTVSSYQGQYETQTLPVNTTTSMASNSRISSQRKDSVDKMAIDFLKQFQEDSDYGASKITIPSKASKIREGSPFSDVSDTHKAASGSEPNHAWPGESPQLKGIPHKYQDSHSESSAGRLSNASIASTSQQKPDKQGLHTFSSLSSIMENYLSETSRSKDKSRVPSSSRSSDKKDTVKHSRSNSTEKSSGHDYGYRGSSNEKYRKDRMSSHRRDSHKDESLQDVSDDDPDPDPNFVQSQLYIGNLPEDITERDLHEYLKNYRAEIWIGYNKSNREDICAFVKLPTMKDSKKMMSDKRADIFKGKKLDVRFTAARDFTDYHIQMHPRGRQSESPRRKRSFSPRKSRRSCSPQVSRRSRSPRGSRISPSPLGSRRSRSPRGSRISPSPRGSRRSRSPRGSRISPSPRGSRRSRSPRGSRISPSPQVSRRSRSPRGSRISPSPQGSRRSRSPRGSRISPSPRGSRRSRSPRGSRRSFSPKRSRSPRGARGNRTRRNRWSFSPQRDMCSDSPRGDGIDPSSQQQLYYSQEAIYMPNPDQGIQYISNPGDQYGVPVYIMPQPIPASQQVFIPSYDFPQPMEIQGPVPCHMAGSYENQQPVYGVYGNYPDNYKRGGGHDGHNAPNWREMEREAEKERQSKTLFMGYVDSAFANAPLLGKKYITEYLSTGESRAVYVCSVCMEMCYDSGVADHVVGYRHRLKCFRKDQPEIYDKLCRIRNKSNMIMECARMAADNEIAHEKITIQMCTDPDERSQKHLENIKAASYIGRSKSKVKDQDQVKLKKESSSIDIFKRIAMYKQKIEDNKKEDSCMDEGKGDDEQKMTSDTKNRSLADSIVAEIKSKQQNEEKSRVAEETEKEKEREEEKKNKMFEEKRKEEEMNKRLEEARQRVIENQKRIEEARLRKIEEAKLKKIDEEKRLKEEEEKRKLKLEEERINEEKRKLAEQRRKLNLEKKLLEQQKIDEAKKQALALAKKREEEMQAEEKRKEEAQRQEEAKRKEEEQKVEMMLQRLEDQKLAEDTQKLEEQKRQEEIRHQEKLQKQMEENHLHSLKQEQMALQKASTEKQLSMKMAGDQSESAMQSLKKNQERMVEEIKNRHAHLKLLQETEDKQRKEQIAAQKRAAALKRIEEMKKAKDALTRETSSTVAEPFPVIYDSKYFETHEHELTPEQKLVHLRKRAYLTLKYSLDEKRMHLRTNIGLEDKIGPDSNSKIDSVLALKYNLKGAGNPLIGLQYVVEGFEGKDDRHIHRYYCEICGVETFHCDGLLQHIIGFGHRAKYLEIHKPDVYDNLMQQDYRRGTLSELMKQEAMKIEKESGRHQIPTLTMYEFRTYALKMKQVETAYRNPVPAMSEIAMNIKHMIQQSEKEKIVSKDEGPIDTTIDIQGFINKTLAMACEISLKEGSDWVDFYRYIQKQRLTKSPMLGLQFVTEVRGNGRYAPKFTCSLCDIVPLSCAEDIYSHLHTATHLEKYLNLVHPERILGNMKLSSKVWEKPEHDKIICDIGYEIGSLQKEKKNIKVGVLLVENIWKIWHERCKENYQQHQSGEREQQQQSTEPKEFSVDRISTGVLKMRPQLYDIIRNSAVPICGLGYLMEIQNDTGLTKYVCDLCNSTNLNQKTILDHLRARNHRRLYMVRKGFDANCTMSEMDQFLRTHPDKEAITVKKLLYLDLQGQNVYSDQEVIKDPGPQKPDEENKLTSNVTQNITKGTDSSYQNIVSGTNVAKWAEQSNLNGTRPTRFDKIVKGLDYTPLLGIEFMTEVQSSSGKFTPIYECDLCNQRGKLSQLCPKNILRHLGTKGHRLAYLQRKHPAAFKDIKSVLDKHERAKKLDHHTKEIASKFGRQEIQIRVETDPLYFDINNFEPDPDDVIITKIEMKQTETAKVYQSRPTVKQSATTSPNVPKDPPKTGEDLPESLPKDPAVNLDQYINKKDYDTDTWQQENEWIQENMKNGQLVPSSRCSKFVAHYNSSFSTYPIIGLQWITEFHKPNAVWWAVCRLCEETIDKWKFLNNHVSSLKHRLRYIEKKYPPIYSALKREQFTVRNESLLRARVYKHSQDIMKTEGQEFKPEVMLQNCQKLLLPVRSNKKSTEVKTLSESVKTISTISTKKPRTDSKYIPQKVKSQSANITVITTGNTPDSLEKESTPQKWSNTETSSNSTSKRLKMDPEDAGPETKDEAPKSMARVFDKPVADNILQTEKGKVIGGEKTMWNEGSIEETSVMKTDEAAILPINRSKEIVDFRGLKRKAVEDIEIHTKTPNLKQVLDDISDDEITIKKSKVDYKRRGYRDSYGSSYGHAQETKGRASSRSSGSRHSSSSHQRQNKREFDRNRDYRKPSSKDRTDKYKSSPKQRNAHVEMKQEVKKAEVVNEKEVESDDGQGDDEDFDAFIMAQLGEDFVTVDELEDIGDVENVDQVKREESPNDPKEEDGNQASEVQLSGEIVKEQNITMDIEPERQPLENVSISAVSAEGENNVKVPSQVKIDSKMDSQSANCAKMDQIEVSVELAEQKTPEKSGKSVKKVAVPISSGPLRFTNLQVEVEIDDESKTDVRDKSAKQENVELAEESNADVPSGKQKSYSLKDFKLFNPETISAQSSVYLGIPISSSTRGSDNKSQMVEIKEVHKSDSSVISLPSDDKTESEFNERETIGTSEKVNKGELAGEKNAKQTMVATGRAQRLHTFNPSYKDVSDKASIVVEVGESNETSHKTVVNIQNELICGSHGLITIDMAESDSQVQKNEPSNRKGEMIAREKDEKNDKTGKAKATRNDAKTMTKSNEGIETSNEAFIECVTSAEGVQKAAFEGSSTETTDNDKVNSLDDSCSIKPKTYQPNDRGTLEIKDQEKISFSKTEKGKGNSLKNSNSNKRPIQSSVKSWMKSSSACMRQTRSSKVTVITMEVDNTSSEQSKTDSSVKGDKTANECEVSIEIG